MRCFIELKSNIFFFKNNVNNKKHNKKFYSNRKKSLNHYQKLPKEESVSFLNKDVRFYNNWGKIFMNEKESNFVSCEGTCLCEETTYQFEGEPENPHLCSCDMCQKSSGAPTVAWVEFSLDGFEWTGKQPRFYQSSEKTQRLSCDNCGGFLGAINEGGSTIFMTISSLRNPDLIVPLIDQHSYKESAPSWWNPSILNEEEINSNNSKFFTTKN